jgi:hypothetical protein
VHEQRVTVAIGLLGVVAALALWLGANMMHLQAVDDGSGNLIAYFKEFGFELAEGNEKDKQPLLLAPCDALVQRCCPQDWLSELPAGTWVDGAPEARKLRQATKAKSATADGKNCTSGPSTATAARAASLPAAKRTSDKSDENSRRTPSKRAGDESSQTPSKRAGDENSRRTPSKKSGDESSQTPTKLPQLAQQLATAPAEEKALSATPSSKEKQKYSRPVSQSPFVRAGRQTFAGRPVLALVDASDHATNTSSLSGSRPSSACEIRRKPKHEFITNFGSKRLAGLDDASPLKLYKDFTRNDRNAGDLFGPLKDLVRQRKDA